MRAKGLLLAVALACVGAITALGQGTGQPLLDPKRTPGVQGPADPNRATFLAASCKNPPAPAAAREGGGPGGPGGRAAAGASATPPPFQDVSSLEIPGVIAAEQKWKVLWEDKGNNADGIVGMNDGSLWLAQNDKSDIVRIDKNGKASVIYTDTYTGGSITAN